MPYWSLANKFPSLAQTRRKTEFSVYFFGQCKARAGLAVIFLSLLFFFASSAEAPLGRSQYMLFSFLSLAPQLVFHLLVLPG